MNKRVSIIMGIYNCEKTLDDAIRSIEKQTYKNWELVMCDDGSTDHTLEIANQYVKRDERIKLLKNNSNLGLPGTLNKCLQFCNGDYIMRHDGDDIMIESRIERQVTYMDHHNCAACGSGVYLFDDNGVWGIRQPELKPGKHVMILDTPFIHPTVMMKREKLIEVGGYSDNYITKQRLEDYDLWLKFYEKGCSLHNIQEPLIYYREDQNSYKRKSRKFRITETKARLDACRRLNIPYLKRLLAFKPLIIMFIPKASLRKYHVWRAKKGYFNVNIKTQEGIFEKGNG
ncbi:glycosyltransferase family 2 protein [Neobacillus mesonae]|uniref:Glycosyltransferase family 2 protein n=1 Tax=Neobacillus mesonae TaxID=1193713 RepID=A0A3Q9QX18_9BACI|nr:glycosyltransferase family 2 protein [Neobacillus mesonae]AZU63759.1 glycosyltransferase family 2 protein [Neobacillus mesonae]